MSWSINMGSIKGIPIKIHLTFFLIVIWGAFQYGGDNGLFGLAYGALLTLLLFGIVLLHELGHSLAALYYNIPVRDITLLPIGGLARLDRMPEKPIQEFVVAAAGPAVNVVLAIVFFPILLVIIGESMFSGRSLMMAFAGPSLPGAAMFLFVVNLSLLIFNLIPAFPLDGGRIFRSLLAMFLDYEKATTLAVRIGQGFAILLGVWGLFPPFNFFTVLIALFIFSAGGAEGRSVRVKNILDGVKARDALTPKNTILQPNYSVMEVASLTLNTRESYFPVLLAENSLVGIVSREGVRRALEKGQNWVYVAEIMHREFTKLDIDTPLSVVQMELVESDVPIVAIYEAEQFQGLLGFEDIERAFYILSGQRPASQPA
jgi:Zn-dependent protease